MKNTMNFFFFIGIVLIALNAKLLEKSKNLITTKSKGSFTLPIKKIKIPRSKLKQKNSMINADRANSFLELENESSLNESYHLTPIEDESYVIDLYVGSPVQIIQGLIDTGSSYSMILSKECYKNGCSGKYGFFDYNRSSTFHFDEPLQYLAIAYESSRSYGQLAYDKFGFSENLMLDEHRMNIIVKTTTRHGYSDPDGPSIIGFALNELSHKNYSIWDEIIKENILDKNVMTYFINDDGGSIEMGYVDPNKYLGGLNHHDLIARDYWSVKLTAIKIDGVDIIDCKNETCYGAMDTGASDIGFSADIYENFLQYTNIIDDCNLDVFDTISFYFDDIEYPFKFKDVFKQFQTAKGESFKCDAKFLKMHMTGKYATKSVLFGNTLFKKYFTVFDRDNYIISMGLKNNDY